MLPKDQSVMREYEPRVEGKRKSIIKSVWKKRRDANCAHAVTREVGGIIVMNENGRVLRGLRIEQAKARWEILGTLHGRRNWSSTIITEVRNETVFLAKIDFSIRANIVLL